MTLRTLFSDDARPFTWSEADTRLLDFGPKGAKLTTLPRQWTLPFGLVSASIFDGTSRDGTALLALGEPFLSRIRTLASLTGQLIVRSSVIGESIWDRGTYHSIVLSLHENDFEDALCQATNQVLDSAPNERIALVLQSYVAPRSRGEFGNLLRISKTRDHWELSTVSAVQGTSRTRFNTQRDRAASPTHSLQIKAGLAPERLFGSIAAWLNNELLLGRPQRLNCEWITDNERIYIVQVDEEDEDLSGINPFQVRVSPIHPPKAAKGFLLSCAEERTLRDWDKLKVLNELWEPDALYKPMLFYVPLSKLYRIKRPDALQQLADDFLTLLGPDNIIVRTSGRADAEKMPNLPRTEGMHPDEASAWCFDKCTQFEKEGADLNNLAFVAHRFIGARASAWARAEPDNPTVEIHGLWGLPDALQYCPYDIWDVHVPTEIAIEYPDYKSHMLLSGEDGGWKYVRVKNELARSLSVGRQEAIDIAIRSASIAQRIAKPCHVMWFVGCIDQDGREFNLPWYWTFAHDAEKNPDRANYQVFTVSDRGSLDAFQHIKGPRFRQAIELKPTDLNLMRDMTFIKDVAVIAKDAGVPVILEGSTLAHVYFALRKEGCTVVTLGERERSRVRRSINFGKLVRDKIPSRIAQRQEAEVTRKFPVEIRKRFLTSKLLEEALEVRNAESPEQKVTELADLYEVVRALAHSEGISLEKISDAANEKRNKVGGFEEGIVLLQTGILSRDRVTIQEGGRPHAQVLAQKISSDTYSIPFSFFGFMEMDQPRSLFFEDAGVRLDVTLRNDRIELRVSREAEQLELPLDLTIDPHSDAEAEGRF